MAYIDKTEVEKLLNIQLNANGQNTVNQIIAGIEAFVDNYCNRTWTKGSTTDITEKFDGGGSVFALSTPPIATVSVVEVDAQALDTSEYKIYGSIVQIENGTSKGLQNVSVTYRTSANTIPADLKFAITMWCSQIFKSSLDGGKVARRVQHGPVSIDYEVSTNGIPTAVQNILDRYVLFNV